MSECNNRNPSPPCKEGYEEKENVLKSGKKEYVVTNPKKQRKIATIETHLHHVKKGLVKGRIYQVPVKSQYVAIKLKKNQKLKGRRFLNRSHFVQKFIPSLLV